jgi:carboxyl-terminal processing protease
VINGLRGVDVEVNLIGGQTCGKPYGFTPTPNCGTTYFSIEFEGVNNKGFGDYPDGLAATCKVSDDLTHSQGDPAEGMLAAALAYNQNKTCPASSTGASMQPLEVVRPEASSIKVLPPRRH